MFGSYASYIYDGVVRFFQRVREGEVKSQVFEEKTSNKFDTGYNSVMDLITKKQQQSDALARQMEEFLAKGGEVKQYRDCSPKEAYYRSNTPLVDRSNPNRILRKKKERPVGPVVFSGYNSGKG